MSDLPDAQNGESAHRGGFGEFAGEATGLIDRSFREQIVLVAVRFPGSSTDQVEANLDVGTKPKFRYFRVEKVYEYERNFRGPQTMTRL